MKTKKRKKDNSGSLSELRTLLVTLISAIVITGSSFIDNAIWTLIFAILGTIVYDIVGCLYSSHLIRGKKAGKDAYAAIFIIIILIGVVIYNGIIKVMNWISSWPIFIKILVLIIFVLGLIITFILIFNEKKNNSKHNEKEV